MPEVTEYLAGFPSWVELATPDLEASKHFYCEVFDWYAYTLTTGEVGEYEVFTIGDVQGPAIGGMYELVDDTQQSSWTVYFRTDDLDASLDRVRAAGGQMLVEPVEIAGLGRLAHCSDPQGADFALWLGYDLRGADVMDEPSAMCWVELSSPDIPEARRFYGQVFGWEAVDRSYHSRPYTEWRLGDRSVAGAVSLRERWAPDTPPFWTPYIWVSDCDAVAARAADLGAQVHVPPTDVDLGRLSILTDPAGARISIVAPSIPDLAAVKATP